MTTTAIESTGLTKDFEKGRLVVGRATWLRTGHRLRVRGTSASTALRRGAGRLPTIGPRE